MNLSLSALSSCIDAELISSDVERETLFLNASTDTRTCVPGSVFFAIVGKRDGHDYIAEAVNKGCAAIVVQKRPTERFAIPVLLVKDSLQALRDLAAFVRCNSSATAIAITGSVGKTTTKDILAQILSQAGPSIKSFASYNNYLGVPLTLSLLQPDTKFAVVEIGTNHPGEILPLAQLADCQIGIVTKIGFAHIGNFGTREAIAVEKLSILTEPFARKLLIINSDDEILVAQSEKLRARGLTVVSVGVNSEADVRINSLECGLDELRFNLFYKNTCLPVVMKGGGPHIALNAALAVAAATACGISFEKATSGLTLWVPTEGRTNWIVSDEGRRVVIDDSYNGSPDSVIAGLEVLASLKGFRKLAVLGEMRELGEWTEKLHQIVGEKVANIECELVAAGEAGHIVRRAAIANGLPETNCRVVNSATESLEVLRELIRSDSLGKVAVLVKGSRFSHMERVVLGLGGTKVCCRLGNCSLYIHCSNCSKLTES